MSRSFLVMFGIGLVVIALGVGGVFYAQRGEHLQAKGSILKVRTAEMEKTRCVLVLDARIENESDVPFTVQSLEMSVETPDGQLVDGILLSPSDVKSTFQYYPLLGEQFNPALTVRDVIAPRSTVDRTVAATFEAFLPELDGRKKITLRLRDQGGSVAEIVGRGVGK